MAAAIEAEEAERIESAVVACDNNMKCRMEGKEASAFEEDAEMRDALFTTFPIGYGDCTPESGEWYAQASDAEGCSRECFDEGTRWISLN